MTSVILFGINSRGETNTTVIVVFHRATIVSIQVHSTLLCAEIVIVIVHYVPSVLSADLHWDNDKRKEILLTTIAHPQN